MKPKNTTKAREIGEHLIVDPRTCFGKLTFKGTRVPVETVLFYLSEGDSIERILESWPQLTREAVQEAIQLAGKALVKQSGAKPTWASDEPTRAGRTA